MDFCGDVMREKRLYRISIMVVGIIIAVAACILAGMMCFKTIRVFAEEELPKASYCSFAIPPEFVPGKEKGLFINKNHPMESSMVRYSYYDNGKENALTNRQKLEKADSEELQPVIADKSTELTRDIYEKAVSKAYMKEYGQDVGFKVSSFDNIKIDGYPGFKIESSFKKGEDETVYQTVMLLMSKYRTFTITYQRAEDDECQETFEESQATIHVH